MAAAVLSHPRRNVMGMIVTITTTKAERKPNSEIQNSRRSFRLLLESARSIHHSRFRSITTKPASVDTAAGKMIDWGHDGIAVKDCMMRRNKAKEGRCCGCELDLISPCFRQAECAWSRLSYVHASHRPETTWQTITSAIGMCSFLREDPKTPCSELTRLLPCPVLVCRHASIGQIQQWERIVMWRDR